MSRLFFHATRSEVSADEIPDWSIKLVALLALMLVMILCAAASTLGTRAAVLFTGMKVSVYQSRRFTRLWTVLLLQVAALVRLIAN